MSLRADSGPAHYIHPVNGVKFEQGVEVSIGTTVHGRVYLSVDVGDTADDLELFGEHYHGDNFACAWLTPDQARNLAAALTAYADGISQ